MPCKCPYCSSDSLLIPNQNPLYFCCSDLKTSYIQERSNLINSCVLTQLQVDRFYAYFLPNIPDSSHPIHYVASVLKQALNYVESASNECLYAVKYNGMYKYVIGIREFFEFVDFDFILKNFENPFIDLFLLLGISPDEDGFFSNCDYKQSHIYCLSTLTKSGFYPDAFKLKNCIALI